MAAVVKVVLIVTALLHIAGCDEHDHKYEVLPMKSLKMFRYSVSHRCIIRMHTFTAEKF